MTELDWTTLVTVLVTQGVSLTVAIYGYKKDSGKQSESTNLTNKNSTLEQDLRRLCAAIFDDVPYAKLKEIAKDMEKDYR